MKRSDTIHTKPTFLFAAAALLLGSLGALAATPAANSAVASPFAAVKASKPTAAAAVPATQVSVQVTNDLTTVSYRFTAPDPTAVRAMYLDTDQNKATGFNLGGIGAEFRLKDSVLYRYTGTGNNWSWAAVRNVSYALDGKTSLWTVARSALGQPRSIDLFGNVETAPLDKGAVVHQVFNTKIAALARDPLKWPFSTHSIWNMPIGKSAVYVPANLPAVPGGDPWAPMGQIDSEPIVLEPKASNTPIYLSTAAWTIGANRCLPTGGVLTNVPMPSSYVVPNSRMNNGAVFLEADGRTLIQTQPLARCTAGGPATALVVFPPVDLYGPGTSGAHGGSGLSSIGGSLRLGELRPGSQGARGPRHALKLDVDSREVLFPCKVRTECFRWPAAGPDTGAVGDYGSLATPTAKLNRAMRMGALLAIPTSVSIASLQLETEPAKQMAWTLQNYGTYIVDSVGGPGYFISAEDGSAGAFRDQFLADWGFKFEQRARDNSPWTRDMQKLLTALYVVDNNSPTSIGGGGAPLQPLAPALP